MVDTKQNINHGNYTIHNDTVIVDHLPRLRGALSSSKRCQPDVVTELNEVENCGEFNRGSDGEGEKGKQREKEGARVDEWGGKMCSSVGETRQ